MILLIGLIGLGVFVGWVIGHYADRQTKTVTVASGATPTTSASGSKTINSAPAFSLGQLAADPTDNWITNGGSLANQRYSPLDEINTSNVSQLKGVWLTHLKSGLAAKYSAESQPLEYDGVIYIPTGQDDVYAISADTGRVLWKHAGNLQ